MFYVWKWRNVCSAKESIISFLGIYHDYYQVKLPGSICGNQLQGLVEIMLKAGLPCYRCGITFLAEDFVYVTEVTLVYNIIFPPCTCVCAQSLSSVQLFVTPWTEARQASPSMGFSMQGYWNGLPFPSPTIQNVHLHQKFSFHPSPHSWPPSSAVPSILSLPLW